jgi:hypothetical protein
MATWTENELVQGKLVCPCFTLAQGRRLKCRLCGKMTCVNETSSYTTHKFHIFWLNSFREKNVGHYFLSNPPISDELHYISCKGFWKVVHSYLRTSEDSIFNCSFFIRLRYPDLSSSGKRLLRRGGLIQKMMSNELLIVLGQQIIFERDKCGHDRLFRCSCCRGIQQ